MGGVSSMFIVFYLAAVYIPSAIATVMRFRHGSIGSLRDEQFRVHRYALDQTTILYGAVFWGALLSCVLVWVLVAAVSFAAVWEVSVNKPFYSNFLSYKERILPADRKRLLLLLLFKK